MVRLASSILATAALLASTISIVSASSYVFTKDCGPGIGDCPTDKPCCSQYGQCGVGAFCLGGCDPLNSFDQKSCAPAPFCSSMSTTTFDSTKIIPKTEYLGDSSKSDWVSDGLPLVSNGELYLTMANGTVGTVLASTAYVWYGKISVTMKTSRGKGVVTAFIMMSDVKDEIDFEWVGVELGITQTNFYWNGVENYDNSHNVSMSGSDTYSDFHTYEVDWQYDHITWSVDGQVGRTKYRNETYNATTGAYQFPQTPSRVQLSIWPGGLASNGKGTIEWAGGLIDWNSEDIQKYGYYYAVVKSVSVQCYDPPAGANIQGKTSYIYTDMKALNSSVEESNESPILASFGATGDNPNYELPEPKSSTVVSTSTNSAGKPTVVTETVVPTQTNVETVPGMEGAGFGTADNDRGGSSSSDTTDSGSSSGSSGSSSGSSSSSSSSSGGFSQGGTTSGKSGAVLVQPEKMVQGSMLAVVIAIIAMVAL